MNRNRFPERFFFALCGLLALQTPARAENHTPRIECDIAMLERARLRIENREEPFHRYWLLARAEADANLSTKARPYSGPDPMAFHRTPTDPGPSAGREPRG